MSVLGVVGIADKGVYSATATYKKMNFVLYNGSTWLALNDNLTGVTPEEGANWKYLARGWAAELLSMISAIDTSGLIGTAGATVTGQALIDEIADRVATKLVLKTAISNQQINDPNKVAGNALVYSIGQDITTLNSNLSVIGNVYSNNPPSYVSCDSGISKEIAVLTLPVGTYIISCYVSWSDVLRGGGRRIHIRQGDYYNSFVIASNGADDFANDASPMEQSASGIVVLTTESKIKLWATQTSGGNLSVDSAAFLKAVRIK